MSKQQNVFFGKIPAYTEVLEYKYGPTWNGYGHWYSGIFKLKDGRLIRAHTPSDYDCNNIEITEVEVVMVPTYTAKKVV